MDKIRGVFPPNSKIILASKSDIKLQAVSEYFNIPRESILCISTTDCELPEQPYHVGPWCCSKRIEHVIEKLKSAEIYNYGTTDEQGKRVKLFPLYIIAIENMITNIEDICCVRIYDDITGKNIDAQSEGISFNHEYVFKLRKQTTYEYRGAQGFSITLGQVIQQEDPSVDPKDWMSNIKYNLGMKYARDYNHEFRGYSSRKDQIIGAFDKMFPLKNTIKKLNENVAVIPNFPNPGVMFKNLSPILKDAGLFHILVYLTTSLIKEYNLEFDKVAGIDSRGFIYGSAIACERRTGFVMIRKKGKSPCVSEDEKISRTYKTEYSTDTLEILKSDITPGDKVLIVDDLCATGGSGRCARDLVEEAGGIVAGYLFILQVETLKDVAKNILGEDIPLIVVLQ